MSGIRDDKATATLAYLSSNSRFRGSHVSSAGKRDPAPLTTPHCFYFFAQSNCSLENTPNDARIANAELFSRFSACLSIKRQALS